MAPRPTTATRMLLLAPACFFAGAALVAAAARFLSGETAHERLRHPHRSLRGGLVQPVGREHAELLLETGGGLRLFLLGEDETRLRSVPAQELLAHVETTARSGAAPVRLRPEPLPGEPPGLAAQFVGRLPEGFERPVAVAVTLPTSGGPRRVRFELGQPGEAHVEPPSMPESSGAPQAAPGWQAELHLTPGGRYTEADIRANGRALPAEKFRDVPVRHDLHPAPGEPICPITRTQANPRLVWSVGGQRYRFCCPPCIDEFVRQAKRDPASIRPPEAYIAR